MSEKLDSQIFRVDAKDCFLEILNSAFPIGKVQMNFIKYNSNTHKQEQKLEFYFDFNTALYLCNLITSGRLDRTIAAAAQSKTFDGKPVNDFTSYFTEMGGINCKDHAKWAKYNEIYPWLTQGSSVSRQFKIQKSSLYKYMFRLEYGNGTVNEKGLIVPTGKSEVALNVPITEKDAIAMALTIQMEMQAYRNQFYQLFASKLFPGQKCNVYERKQDNGHNTNASSNNSGGGNGNVVNMPNSRAYNNAPRMAANDGFVPVTNDDELPFK